LSTQDTQKSSTVRSTATVSSATGFSRILGLIREQVMAYFFGASMATDAFVTAFRIPNLLRDMFAEGALSSAFVPIFKEKLVNRDKDDAFELARSILGLLIIAVGLIVLIGTIAAPAIIYLTANGFTADMDKFHLTVSLTRWMFVYLLFVSVAALFMGMLNSFGRFGIPALAPALFNVAIIGSVLIFHNWFEQPIYAMSIGVLIGGLGQMAIQLPPLLKLGFKIKPKFSLFDPAVKKVLALMGPMIGGMSAGRVNILVSTLLASFLVEGSISYLNYSFRLMHFPLGVFAVALGTVALPRASELAARGDRDAMAKALEDTINLNSFLVIPSAVALALLGRQLIDLIYAWGAFSETDAANTALTLLHYSYGLIGFAMVRVTVPFFYALKDAKRPMYFSIISIAVNLLLYYPMIKLLSFAGLAAATSLGAIVNLSLLLYGLRKIDLFPRFPYLALQTSKVIVASALAVIAGRQIPIPDAWQTSEVMTRLAALIVPLIIAVVLYLVICFILRVDAAGQIVRQFKKRG
jgi:putative peptidoglycan lipid II flippase